MKMTGLSYMISQAKSSLRCDVVLTSATLVYFLMTIILCDLGSTYSYVLVQLPWDLMWFVMYYVTLWKFHDLD